MKKSARGWLLTLVFVGAGAGLCCAAWWTWSAWRYRGRLAEVQQMIQSGRHGAAARALRELLDLRPDSLEADYLLGVCEKARGRGEEALEAWARIPPDSRFAPMALVGRATVEVDRGRLASAERLLTEAIADRRVDPLPLRRFLAPLFWQEGRRDEAMHLIEANWETLRESRRGGSEQAIELVRLHIALSVGMAPVDAVRSFLDRAGKLEPTDDRVWLGKANLAIRANALDEAADWLERCVQKGSADEHVWRSSLDCAMAAGNVDRARDAAVRIPGDGFTQAGVARIAAWFAARRGDRDAERAALQRLIAAEPEDGAALDRLVELAVRSGDSERAIAIRQQKAAIDRVKAQFQELFRRDQPLRDAADMATFAEQLGRSFEARVFASIALDQDPSRDDLVEQFARLDLGSLGSRPSGRSLADLLFGVLEPGRSSAPAAARAKWNPNPAALDRLQFRDDAAAAGLHHVFDNGESPNHQIPEVSSGGVGLIDFDGDGWLDIYALQGGPFPPGAGSSTAGDRLFRNRRDGTFEDVTARAALPVNLVGYGHGVAVGDFDNDGHPDLFVTRWNSYSLYRNRGDGRFEDVTTAAGLDGVRDWPTSAAWADLDGDGDLDLYVCHYLKWDCDHPKICRDARRGTIISCDPRTAPAAPDHVFRNDRGRFVDVASQAGFVDREGRGFGVVAVDIDDDNRIDLAVANDMSHNYLFHNEGQLQFREVGLLSGIACNAHGGNQAGMGIAAGDLDGDGRPDLAVTNFFNESTSLFHNLGHGQFVDHTSAAGLATPSRDLLGFGIAFLDVDNDGWLDLLTANGHVNDYRPEIKYRMCLQLLVGGQGGRLTDISAAAGPPFLGTHLGRGLVIGDLDNDGRIDAVVVAHNEPLIYLHNQSTTGHSITFSLEGTASNRDGVGARITIESGGIRQVAQRTGGGSFLSASDPRVRFGVGPANRVDRLEVRWPSGRIDEHLDLAVDRIYRVREGAPTPIELPGARADQPRKPKVEAAAKPTG
jgi:tetratricopeptide (TPR) repeat protein